MDINEAITLEELTAFRTILERMGHKDIEEEHLRRYYYFVFSLEFPESIPTKWFDELPYQITIQLGFLLQTCYENKIVDATTFLRVQLFTAELLAEIGIA